MRVMRIVEAVQRLGCSRKTIWLLCVSGVLIRKFRGCQTLGVTLDSIEKYENGMKYRVMKERGEVQAMGHRDKDLSPLHHMMVMGARNPLKKRVRQQVRQRA